MHGVRLNDPSGLISVSQKIFVQGIVGVNWSFFAVQFSSWVGTLFVCGFGTAALFSAVSVIDRASCLNI
jgi:hypothetical protein